MIDPKENVWVVEFIVGDSRSVAQIFCGEFGESAAKKYADELWTSDVVDSYIITGMRMCNVTEEVS